MQPLLIVSVHLQFVAMDDPLLSHMVGDPLTRRQQASRKSTVAQLEECLSNCFVHATGLFGCNLQQRHPDHFVFRKQRKPFSIARG